MKFFNQSFLMYQKNTLLFIFSLLFVINASATSWFKGEPQAEFTEADAAPWEKIERHRDYHPRFPKEPFHPKLHQMYPQIVKAFGTDVPHSSQFLLHLAPGWQNAKHDRPVLLIHGANDDATRRYARPLSTADKEHLTTPGLMQHLVKQGLAVFAVSFSHYHGDNILQGEHVGNAITRIKQLMGKQDDANFKVDLVTFSKGAMAARCYVQSASHYYQKQWLTQFRDDVRTVVFQCGPIGGLDMMYRYYLYNLTNMTNDVPAPLGAESIVLYGFSRDTGINHILSGYWPGQTQMIYDQRELGIGYGALSMTMDMNMTMVKLRDGGSTMWLKSKGLDAARKAGGDMIAVLNERGFPENVTASLLAGDFPILYNEMHPEWKIPAGAELTAPSDGLVYKNSALYKEGIEARGAKVVDTKVLNLNHIDLSRDERAYKFVTKQLLTD
jgi:hypothetical protein